MAKGADEFHRLTPRPLPLLNARVLADEPGSEQERAAFKALQARLLPFFERVFPDRMAPRTVLVNPSLSLDTEVMAKISGVHHYEERMFCLLLLLRYPTTRVIYVTSQHVSETVVDYFLHLLPGVPTQHARNRLTLLSCHDGSLKPLTQKILDRPRLLARIEEALGDKSLAHMTCFNVSPLERTLAVRLGIPIYGCDPDLLALGSKSGSREVFREAGLAMAEGYENLRDEGDVADGLVQLKASNSGLARAVVKLNEGFSGEGNAVMRFDGAPDGAALTTWVKHRLPQISFAAKGMGWDQYRAKIADMGAIVEAFVEGDIKRSPSVQFRITPAREVETISSHDQVLGGEGEQVFLGCQFPADDDYRLTIEAEGRKAAAVLCERGVLGRFGIDFISVKDGKDWRHYAIEINLRKGGTTHPQIMLQFLTDGRYDPESGLFFAPGGRPRYYYASDNIESERYRGLTPQDLMDIALKHGIHFHQATQKGVVFHLIGALSEFGKLGAVCVGESRAESRRLYDEMITILDRESAGS